VNEQQREAKRERDRVAAAAYRARKRAEAAEAARARADAAAGVMRQSVDASIEAARWFTASDAASIAQLRALADIADRATADGDVRTTLRVHPMITKALAEMGLSPRTRMQLELRARKIQASSPDAVIDRQSNVTRLRRPPKRH